MSKYVRQNWNTVPEPETYYHEEGYYVVKFKNIADMNEILYAGPYSINNRPMILKQWTPDFDCNAEFLTELPLWVKFPYLPMSCWSKDSLSRIASAIGVPKYVDKCTAKQTRISFARMLIEVNVTKTLPSKITVMDPSRKTFQQGVIFEWKLEYCERCLMIDHNCDKQRRDNLKTEDHKQTRPIERKKRPQKLVSTWVPKVNTHKSPLLVISRALVTQGLPNKHNNKQKQ
ncbi:PREDICTED: uncharacterized protein LOC109239591 [Nicotiana attenuata]|uniref:uncharacterized protein LOC109239591 n=1 Tax=Nicotiana attenuata TaxID=49451 RepID=UPI000905D803|nr:PREDICTED: uncharacterized protein LOC109239591 [Nicotiana attenuata]